MTLELVHFASVLLYVMNHGTRPKIPATRC